MKLVDGDKEIEIERAQVLEIGQNDVITITVPRWVPQDERDSLINFFSSMFPGRKVIALIEGMAVSVAREAPDGA